MKSVTISSKRQITIPAEVFRLLELKEGQKLLVEVEGGRIILTARPFSLTKAFGGITKGLYGSHRDQADGYINEERDSWPK